MFCRTIFTVVDKVTLPGLRGTTSRVPLKQIQYRTSATTASRIAAIVNRRRMPSAAVFSNCGATTKASRTPVTADAMDRAPARRDRSVGSSVMAADNDPYGILTKE